MGRGHDARGTLREQGRCLDDHCAGLSSRPAEAGSMIALRVLSLSLSWALSGCYSHAPVTWETAVYAKPQGSTPENAARVAAYARETWSVVADGKVIMRGLSLPLCTKLRREAIVSVLIGGTTNVRSFAEAELRSSCEKDL